MSFRVLVLPSDLSFVAEENETVMDAAIRHGITWPSICGGQQECGVCFVEVINPEKVEDSSGVEASLIRRMAHRGKRGGVIRLACCLVPKEDVELYRLGPRKKRETGVPN